MKRNTIKQATIKFSFLIIVPFLVVAMLTLTQCQKEPENTESPEIPRTPEEPEEPEVFCTSQYEHIGLMLKYPDGQPVLLDSSTVFWESENRFLAQNKTRWNEARVYGNYTIVNDDMQRELKDREEIMHFVGYLNGKIVHERDILVGADVCHVNYLGTEPLTQIIDGVSDAIRGDKFCELVNTERIRDIIPSFHAFRGTFNNAVSHDNKLQMIVDWFLSHDCITNARVEDNNIAFSFVENGKTINMIMFVSSDAYFAGFRLV